VTCPRLAETEEDGCSVMGTVYELVMSIWESQSAFTVHVAHSIPGLFSFERRDTNANKQLFHCYNPHLVMDPHSVWHHDYTRRLRESVTSGMATWPCCEVFLTTSCSVKTELSVTFSLRWLRILLNNSYWVFITAKENPQDEYEGRRSPDMKRSWE